MASNTRVTPVLPPAQRRRRRLGPPSPAVGAPVRPPVGTPPVPAVVEPNPIATRGWQTPAAAPGTTAAPTGGSIGDRVANLIDAGGPLMQQAATQGARLAQRRGLGSSSIAIGAAQNETYRVAAPLATAEAQIVSNEGLQRERNRLEEIMQSRQLTAQEQMQLRDIQNQQYMQREGINSAEGLAQRRNELELLMQSRQLTASEEAQLRDIKSREGMQGRDIASTERMQARDVLTRTRLARMEQQNQRYLSRLDRDTQMRIADMNVGSAERAQLASLMGSYQSTYEQQIEAINANKLLKPDARAAQIRDLQVRRERFADFLSGVYEVDIGDWGASPVAPPPTGGGGAVGSGGSGGATVANDKIDGWLRKASVGETVQLTGGQTIRKTADGGWERVPDRTQEERVPYRTPAQKRALRRRLG